MDTTNVQASQSVQSELTITPNVIPSMVRDAKPELTKGEKQLAGFGDIAEAIERAEAIKTLPEFVAAIIAGNQMTIATLRTGIHQAHALGIVLNAAHAAHDNAKQTLPKTEKTWENWCSCREKDTPGFPKFSSLKAYTRLAANWKKVEPWVASGDITTLAQALAYLHEQKSDADAKPRGKSGKTTTKPTVKPAAKPPTIDDQKEAVTVTENDRPRCAIHAEGTKPLTYQWFELADSQWKPMGEPKEESYSSDFPIRCTLDMDGRQYRCTVTNDGGTIETKPITLTVISTAKAEEIEIEKAKAAAKEKAHELKFEATLEKAKAEATQAAMDEVDFEAVAEANLFGRLGITLRNGGPIAKALGMARALEVFTEKLVSMEHTPANQDAIAKAVIAMTAARTALEVLAKI